MGISNTSCIIHHEWLCDLLPRSLKKNLCMLWVKLTVLWWTLQTDGTVHLCISLAQFWDCSFSKHQVFCESRNGFKLRNTSAWNYEPRSLFLKMWKNKIETIYIYIYLCVPNDLPKINEDSQPINPTWRFSSPSLWCGPRTSHSWYSWAPHTGVHVDAEGLSRGLGCQR